MKILTNKEYGNLLGSIEILNKKVSEITERLDRTIRIVDGNADNDNSFNSSLIKYLGLEVEIGKKVEERFFSNDKIVKSFTFTKAKKASKK